MYPLLTAIVSAGQRDVRPLVMVLINVVAVAVCAWLCWLLALDYFAGPGTDDGGGSGASTLTPRERGVGPSWWILLAVINPSLMLALQLDLPEPLAYACTLGGLLAWRRGRVALCALCFAVALLTREVTIMVILPVVIVTALRRRWLDAVILAAAAVPYLAWRVALARILAGTDNTTTWASDFGLPFGGIVATIRGSLQQLEHHQLRSFVIHQGSILAVVVIVLAAGVLGLWQLRRGGDPIVAGTFVTAAVVGIVGSGGVWDAYANAGRDFGLIFPMLVFSLAARRPYRSLALWLCVLSALLTLFTLYRGLAVTPSVAYTVTP
jgi:hypothetical protein